MQVSNEIINVLEYLGEKIGLTIDWTSQNVLPYLEQLCGKFIKWEIGTSILWMIMAALCIIVGFIFMKCVDLDGLESIAFWCIVCVAIGVIGFQAFDIIECYTFPEKAIYDYIHMKLQSM